MALIKAKSLPDGADPNHVAAVIDREEFEQDRKDIDWREFVKGSAKHVAQLEQDGRSK